MKKVFSILALVALVAVVAQAQAKQTKASDTPAAVGADKVNGPVMSFEKTEIDYGTIAQGSDPLRKFKFKNTGTAPLTITSASGSCGCTVPNYKKEPIAAGETAEIEVRYDTQRVGPFTKTVTVVTNEGAQPRVLVIKGTVIEKKAEESVPASAPSLIATPKQ